MLTLADANPTIELAKWIPVLPFAAMAICGLLCCFHSEGLRRLAALVTTASILGAFVISVMVMMAVRADSVPQAHLVKLFDWIHIGTPGTAGAFTADISFYIDTLTCVMLMVVTGIGTLIAWYASGYMAGDHGYARFFAYIALFIFAMTSLVMADNLLLLYLGWEGVGAASYLLIGYYYRKPSAVAAAKKAFIVNRIGDFGFALGLMATFVIFGTIKYAEIFPAATVTRSVQVVNGEAQVPHTGISLHNDDMAEDVKRPAAPAAAPVADHEAKAVDGAEHAEKFDTISKAELVTLKQDASPAGRGVLAKLDPKQNWWLLAIPFLLMLGAFGKSAQLPLHVWLPDAMEGPTPVSALIHAATMVTAGVYMIARLITLFQLNPIALHTIACVGATTAIFAATIALCQYDIKRIWAYSTLSQLGFMFAGVGVLGTTGAVFHLFTHAFFKALLFLTAGSVMHALAGQLDLRKMSGLFRKMPVTAVLMLIGCLALAGIPGTAGFYSKDTIVTDVMLAVPNLGWVLIATALLTAFYTFRLWFRVFLGEEKYEMGHEHHGYEVDHIPDDHAHGPHEMPFFGMNLPLCVLAVGAIAAGFMCQSWMASMITDSSAHVEAHHTEAAVKAHEDMHRFVGLVTGGGAVVMIALAAFFHWINRPLTAKIATNPVVAPIVRLLNNKYYIDELYDYVIRLPLRAVGWISYLFDRLIIDGLVDGAAKLPRGVAFFAALAQRGALQGYAMTMAIGLVVILFVVAWKVMAGQ